ncbi:MAG: hypothetical protein PsegKO_31720 [Pseudohongiellaceae bacterium]
MRYRLAGLSPGTGGTRLASPVGAVPDAFGLTDRHYPDTATAGQGRLGGSIGNSVTYNDTIGRKP